MGGRAVDEQRLRDLVVLRRVRDRIDREYAQPLDVQALARGAHMSAGYLSREFRRVYATVSRGERDEGRARKSREQTGQCSGPGEGT